MLNYDTLNIFFPVIRYFVIKLVTRFVIKKFIENLVKYESPAQVRKIKLKLFRSVNKIQFLNKINIYLNVFVLVPLNHSFYNMKYFLKLHFWKKISG